MAWRIRRVVSGCGTAAPLRRAGRGASMREIDHQTDESPNFILLPMAVGALFLIVLVAGALLG